MGKYISLDIPSSWRRISGCRSRIAIFWLSSDSLTGDTFSPFMNAKIFFFLSVGVRSEAHKSPSCSNTYSTLPSVSQKFLNAFSPASLDVSFDILSGFINFPQAPVILVSNHFGRWSDGALGGSPIVRTAKTVWKDRPELRPGLICHGIRVSPPATIPPGLA